MGIILMRIILGKWWPRVLKEFFQNDLLHFLGPLLPHGPSARSPAVVNNLVDRDGGQGEAVPVVNDEKSGPSKNQCEPVVVTLWSNEFDESEGGGGSGLGDNPSVEDSFERQHLGGSESDFRAFAQPRRGRRKGSSLAQGNHTVRKSPR